jgi:predicted ATP-grasp superfamily ATP-dependent carboligase
MPHVLLVGVSMRAAAVSASRAGYDVTAIDAFGDIDVPATVRILPLTSGAGSFSPPAAARAARGVTCDAVVYGSGFENHPRAVAALAHQRVLWGNPPEVLRRVRCPRHVLDTFRGNGFRVPDMFEPGESGAPGEKAAAAVGTSSGKWIEKPYRSGGGHGVHAWHPGAPVTRGAYLQTRVDGIPGSVVFVAAAGDAVPLGVSRQLVGDPVFGAGGFRYCGSIVSHAGDLFGHDPAVIATASALARVAARAHGLVGVNGLDFVARDGVPYPLEINPRWSASMELVERAYGTSVFAAHATACADGALPAVSSVPSPPAIGKMAFGKALGKAIVFARRAAVAHDTRGWLEHDDVSDVPAPGTLIPSGAPVCTVFAEGETAAGCYAALVRRAQDVYSEMRLW